jgi:acetylornithine deacetylase/succinyl-diaminopimelate desuccinylase-like protein
MLISAVPGEQVGSSAGIRLSQILMKVALSSIQYARANRLRFVGELKEFVRFRTISAQDNYAAELKECADWLADHLRQIGMGHVKTIVTRRHPIVFAQSRHIPGLPTVLIYGHYDVQPPEPIHEWRSPPFEPTIRGDQLYGRGASDDKGQLFAHIKALESYYATTGRVPVNVKCLFEGEEEIGSANLHSFLMRNKELLAADVAVVSDTRMLGPRRPAITYSLRGALSVELEVLGPEVDLHSGNFGGAVLNPLQALCEILARLHDERGRVAIPGFYRRVRNCDDNERSYMARVGPQDEQILRDARAKHGWGEDGYTLYERTTVRPALTINGISGGYQGEGVKAVIPSRAIAKLNFRLVPDQEPHEIARDFRNHISRIAPSGSRANVRTSFTALPVALDRTAPVMQAASAAYQKSFGVTPAFIRSGGTIPVVSYLQNLLGVPTVLMGFALPDDGLHAPNEKFDLNNFGRAICTSIHFLAEVSARRNLLFGRRRQRVVYAANAAGS